MISGIIAFRNKTNYLRTNITHNTKNSSDSHVQFQRLVVTQRSLLYNASNNKTNYKLSSVYP